MQTYEKYKLGYLNETFVIVPSWDWLIQRAENVLTAHNTATSA